MPRKETLPAKITRPRSRGVYPRTRLFGELNAARSAPCIWISGPPGAGKTILAVSYLETEDIRSLWYQVDEGDADIASFFHYLGLAARKASRRRKQLPWFTPEFTGGLPAFTRRFFEQLYSWLKPPFVLVLDNYQLLPDEAALHEVIPIAVETLPEGGNVLILSRQAPPAGYARLQANRLLSLVEWEQLQLDFDEIRGIVALLDTAAVPDQRLAELERQSQGWVAGLMLLLQGNAIAMPETESLLDQPPQQVFDYFAREIFAQEDSQARSILMQTALLPKATQKMARALTGNPSAGSVLTRLQRQNYFIQQHVGKVALYQFHPMFQAFLLERLTEELTTGELIRLRHKAAVLLEQADQPDAAIEQYRTAGDWAECKRLIHAQAPFLLQQGRNLTLRDWITRLPREVTDDSPWTRYWLGTSWFLIDDTTARKELIAAYQSFKKSTDMTGRLIALSGVLSTFLNQWSAEAELETWTREARSLWETDPNFPDREVEARFITSLFGAQMFLNPDHETLHELAELVFNLVREIKDTQFKLMASAYLSFFYGWLGKIRQSVQLVEYLEDVIEADAPIPWQAMFLWLKAIRKWHTAESGHGFDDAQHALELVRKGGSLSLEGPLLAQGAMIAFETGRESLGLSWLNEFNRDVASHLSTQRAFRSYLLANAAWRHEDYEDAMRHLEECERICREGPHKFGIAETHAAWARIYDSIGDRDSANKQLAICRRIGREMGSDHLEYNCRLIEAEWALNDNREALGREKIRNAFQLGRNIGLFSTTWLDHQQLTRLCTEALKQNVEVEHAREIIRRKNLRPPNEDAIDDLWPWPVRIRALGDFHVDCDGEPIDGGKKSQRKAIELFKVLIAFGGKEVSATRLEEALWPDAEADTARSNLKSTVHRLRKLLGHPEAIEMSAGQLNLNPQICWTDVWEFERLIQKAGNGDSRADLLYQAIHLYKGPLLGNGEDTGWLIPARERLHRLYLGIVRALGKQLESEENFEEAIAIYENGIAVDELAENLYRSLMQCYLQLGEIAEAMVVFKRCCTVLKARLDVAPSRQTQAVAEQLRQA